MNFLFDCNSDQINVKLFFNPLTGVVSLLS